MPDPFIIILFFVFFILPLIERAMKNRQPPPPPPGQRPPEEVDAGDEPTHALPRAPRSSSRLPAPAPGETGAGDDPAADMIPDDLWEILTGEKRQRPPSPPRPAQPRQSERAGHPQEGAGRDRVERSRDDEWLGGFHIETSETETPVEAEQVYDTEVGDEIAEADLTSDEDSIAERLREDRERAVHTADRAPQRGERDALVIYEPGIPAPHRPRSVARPMPVPLPPPERVQRPAAHALRLSVSGDGDRAELRRAFILKEILDPPKGLE